MQYKRWGETGFQSSADYQPVNATRQLTANPVTGLTTIYFSQIWLTFFICLYFTNLITFLLLLLFVFISLKHNKLQMIYWGYHNCYGNLELSIDLWFKAKHGFIVNTATDEEKKNPRTTGFKGTKVDIGQDRKSVV